MNLGLLSFSNADLYVTLTEANSSTLKIDDYKTILSFREDPFSGVNS